MDVLILFGLGLMDYVKTASISLKRRRLIYKKTVAVCGVVLLVCRFIYVSLWSIRRLLPATVSFYLVR
ncbi:unnamed protein product, partial [Linum tenue]